MLGLEHFRGERLFRPASTIAFSRLPQSRQNAIDNTERNAHEFVGSAHAGARAPLRVRGQNNYAFLFTKKSGTRVPLKMKMFAKLFDGKKRIGKSWSHKATSVIIRA